MHPVCHQLTMCAQTAGDAQASLGPTARPVEPPAKKLPYTLRALSAVRSVRLLALHEHDLLHGAAELEGGEAVVA